MEQNLTGYINLKDRENHQFIYASQNNGTFYCVYAKFIIENDLLKSINFYIHNYKGLFKLKFKTSLVDVIGLKDEVLRIGIIVQPIFGNDETSTVDLTEKKININNIKHLYLERGYLRLDRNNDHIDDGFTLIDGDVRDIEGLVDNHLQREEVFFENLLNKDIDFNNRKKIFGQAAVGRNCRISLMRVI